VAETVRAAPKQQEAADFLFQDVQEVRAMRQARVAKQGDMWLQELIMAFAAGGASMFLILGAVQTCASSWAASRARSRRSKQTLLERDGLSVHEEAPPRISSSGQQRLDEL
jgi:hypothetical protein